MTATSNGRPDPGKIRRIALHHRLLRALGAGLGAIILRYRLVDDQGGLGRAEALLAQGYGLVVIINHFSLRDAPQALVVLARNPAIRQREIIAPVAIHQFARYDRLVRAFAGLFALQLCPVVTPHTSSGQYSGEEVKESLRAYVARTLAVLERGGVVLLAPQARRAPRLSGVPGRAVAKLLGGLDGSGGDPVALTVLAFGIPGASDYAREHVGGLNLGTRYEARIGATATLGEIGQEIADSDEIDAWVLDRLREVVPPAYRDDAGATRPEEPARPALSDA